MVNMTKAGEVGGFLDGALKQVAENYEAEVKLRGKIKAAMTYPTVVFVMAIAGVIGMLLFIVPVFAKLFKQLGGKLPAPTQLLVTLSSVLKTGFPVLIVFAIAFAVIWRRTKHTSQVRNALDPLKLKVPVFGKLFQKIAVARFARNLGTMIRSGVSTTGVGTPVASVTQSSTPLVVPGSVSPWIRVTPFAAETDGAAS